MCVPNMINLQQGPQQTVIRVNLQNQLKVILVLFLYMLIDEFYCTWFEGTNCQVIVIMKKLVFLLDELWKSTLHISTDKIYVNIKYKAKTKSVAWNKVR